ncbi:hypothetical protein D3C76_1189730 [compost metagenome]
MPWTKRQNSRLFKSLADASIKPGRLSNSVAATNTVFWLQRRVSTPTKGATRATARVVEVMLQLTCWAPTAKLCASSARMPWVA